MQQQAMTFTTTTTTNPADRSAPFGGRRPAAALCRTVVAEPFPMVRSSLTHALRDSATVEVVGEAETRDECLALCRRRPVDTVVTSVDLMWARDGIALCRELKQLPKPPDVIIVSVRNEPDVITDCLEAGADGFVHLSAQPQQLVQAVEATMRRGRPPWFLGDRIESRARRPVSDLTVREQQVLALLLRRYSNEEIAAELQLAHQTVKNYVSRVLRKRGMSGRKELFSRRHPESS
ncbi:response regulator transcription factor [Streptomyces sp. CA-132043]|uniref:response regulator transcription factor n=1 Tax=Streptomyces sp. CA-132043 TaxID=3240048 RepID=UPI003D8A4CA1